jgi:mannose-6-phosphate isomerase-like protein (cupin superfamily)
VTLCPYDSVLVESDEPHRAENRGDERAVGIDASAPGRSFDFRLDRE